MKSASNYAFLKRKVAVPKPVPQSNLLPPVPVIENVDIDTNVISVKFDSLKQAEENLQMGDAVFCKQCKACLSSVSKLYTKQQYQAELANVVPNKAANDEIEEEKEEKKQPEKELSSKIDKEKAITTALADDDKVWVCEFCGVHNLVNLDKEELPQSEDLIYLLKSAQQINKNQDTSSDITTIFCIDNSGSMSVTHEIKGKHDIKNGLSEEEYEMLKQFIEYGADQYLPNQKKDTTFITRKQCVLAAIEAQLLEMKAEFPNRKVGLVTFDNEVTVIGDGKDHPEVITGDKLYKQDILRQIGSDFGKKMISTTVKESAENLIEKFSKLHESGKTALGPALIISLGLALEGKQGSRVILCTDGLANIGLGEMDTPEGYAKAEEFYTQMAHFAKENGISVTVISIKGEGCKLDILSKLADLTSGSVIRVDPDTITDKFANIMKQQLIGTQVEVKLRLHRGMKFRNEAEEFLRERGSLFEKNVGNVTAKTELTFEYEMRPDEELVEFGIDSGKLERVPFQAQIIYNSTNGDRLMRVITNALKTTNNLEEAEKDLNVNLMAARALQQQAQLASKGLYQESNQVADVWGNYFNDRVAGKADKKGEKVINNYNIKNTKMQDFSNRRHDKVAGNKDQEKKEGGFLARAKEAIQKKKSSLSRKKSIEMFYSDDECEFYHDAKNCNSDFEDAE